MKTGNIPPPDIVTSYRDHSIDDRQTPDKIIPKSPDSEPLTRCEMAVLRLVAQGLENKDIADALHYSPYTVANQLRTVYEKLRVTNRTQAALYALRQGWARLDQPNHSYQE
ncbi:MAG TPA: response regulator transcription factor [Candidatus Saccharimonadales bacterium]|nr:response regulator transcription factor [Candidatus Saccharimonadales bacterium]